MNDKNLAITVYCGANYGNRELYKEKMEDLADWIAKKDHSIVYGGGRRGLMGVLAARALENDTKIAGIIPEFLIGMEGAMEGIEEMIVVDTMSERKKFMALLGDAFIAMPGGVGTLEEIAEVISWAIIGKNPGPCIVFNVDGFFDPLKMMLDNMVDGGFLEGHHRDNVLFTEDLDEMEEFIKNYKAPVFRTYDSMGFE